MTWTEIRSEYKYHHKYGTPTYNSWYSMKSRCNNPNHQAYKNYGGRGIEVCDDWFDFNNFYADMGERPDGTYLDRIDNDGNYCKENCRWSTPAENNTNKRNNLKEMDIKTVKFLWHNHYTLVEISNIVGLKYNTVSYIIYKLMER